jgi:hypothetical protein
MGCAARRVLRAREVSAATSFAGRSMHDSHPHALRVPSVAAGWRRWDGAAGVLDGASHVRVPVMSRIFGPIRQNGYVVRDLEAAMAHWTSVLGIGPFFHLPHLPIEQLVHRGRPAHGDVSIALAFSGDLQIELIQQHDDAPSVYKEFLDAGREGLQHVSAWTTDFDDALARAAAAGYAVLQQGTIVGGVRFAYFDTELHPGTVFEISNVIAEPFRPVVDMMRDAARTWDGTDPIRRL